MERRLISMFFILFWMNFQAEAQTIEVTDPLGDPIASAKVLAAPLSEAKNGTAIRSFDPNLEPLSSGLYLLTVTAQGWRSVEHIVFFRTGEKSLITVVLEPARIATRITEPAEMKLVSGQVRGYKSLRPLRIRAIDPAAPAIIGDIEPDSNGGFSMRVRTSGPVMVLLLYRGTIMDSRLVESSDNRPLSF